MRSTNADRLRIGFLIAHFHPRASGAEMQALRQAQELVRRGHVVHVLTSHIAGLPTEVEMVGVRVHRWIRARSFGPLFGLTFVASAVGGLRRLRDQIDLVHTHQAVWESVSAGVARGVLRTIPSLVQPASAGYYGEAEELARTKGYPILRRIALNNSGFAAISSEIARQWRALGVPADRLVRTVSGVDTTRFRPGPCSVEDALPPRPRVVFTGRLHPQKNLDLLLEAWPPVVERTGAHLLLIGQGDQQPHLVERAESLGVSAHVHTLGHVDDPAEHLRAAQAFALPSVAEGMSNSLLEAMATGLPCLASAIGGNTDLLDDGAGLLVPSRPDAWTDALIEVLTDPTRAKGLGQRARARIDDRHAIDAVVDHNLAIYRRLLEVQGTDEPPFPDSWTPMKSRVDRVDDDLKPTIGGHP